MNMAFLKMILIHSTLYTGEKTQKRVQSSGNIYTQGIVDIIQIKILNTFQSLCFFWNPANISCIPVYISPVAVGRHICVHYGCGQLGISYTKNIEVVHVIGN